MPPPAAAPHATRIWDLPTRLFHWCLAASVVALVVTAKVGGNAMVWHERLGYAVLALLVFRLVWGVVGGRWSRWSLLLRAPFRLPAYLRGQEHPDDAAGHSPLGALSVFAMLGALALQVLTGLMSDDAIAFAGPLSAHVPGAWVEWSTWYHKAVGQYLVLGLVALHVIAIATYVLVRKRRLIAAMLHGDKHLSQPVDSANDGAAQWALAAVILGLSGALAWWVSGLGTAAF